MKKKRYPRILAAFLALSLLFTSIPALAVEPAPIVSWPETQQRLDESPLATLDAAPVTRTNGALAWEDDAPATRGEVVEMLLAAADDYNPGVTKADVIHGYGDGDLREDQNVTRAEALVMLVRAFGELPERKGYNTEVGIPAEDFTDIPAWAAEGLAPVFEAGLVAGTAAGTFSPNDPVTHHQMELFIRRTYALFGTNERDDLYETANKAFFESASVNDLDGTLYEMAGRGTDQIMGILDEVASAVDSGEDFAEDSPEMRVYRYIESVQDLDMRNAVGFTPIADDLAAIGAAESLDELGALSLLDDAETGLSLLLDFEIDIDLNDPTAYIAYFNGITPTFDKTVYNGGDPVRYDAYVKYLTTIAALCGKSEGEAAALAQDYMDVEAQLADADAFSETYHSLREMQAWFPDVALEEAFAHSGCANETHIRVMNEERIHVLADWLTDEHFAQVKDYLTMKVIAEAAPYFGEAFLQAYYDYELEADGLYPYTLYAQALMAAESDLSEDLLALYQARYGDPEVIRQVRTMCEEIRDVFSARIQALDWMSEETKARALQRLEETAFYIGGPSADVVSSLDGVVFPSAEEGGSYFDHAMSLRKAKAAHKAQLSSAPLDAETYIWNAIPAMQGVASAVPEVNAVVITQITLQAPFFDPAAPEEEQLAGFGFTIAHELTHILTSYYDMAGQDSVDWWTEEDWARFDALCDEVIRYYDGWEVLPGIATDGGLSVQENVADLGGWAIVMDIAAARPDFDYEACFEKVARLFAETQTRSALQYLSYTDVHSFGNARINRMLSSYDEFYETYDIQPGDGMYVAPEDRVAVW